MSGTVQKKVTTRMQILGLCRFSYLGHGGYQTDHETLEERAAFLYDPDRLEKRFAMFESITLPSIKNQTDQDFLLILAIGESFPQPYYERLMDLVSGIPMIEVAPLPPGRHRKIMRRVMNNARDLDMPCLQFRLDDDDAVGLKYIAELRAAANDLRPLRVNHETIAIDFNRGYAVQPTKDGLLAEKIVENFTCAGLAVAIQPHSTATVVNYAHHRVFQAMPTVTYTHLDMIVRGINGLNDSRQAKRKEFADSRLLNPEGELYFRNTFGIDVDRIRDLYQP